LFGQGSVQVREWSVRERRRLSQDDAGFRLGSAIEAGAAGAVRNEDRRRNRLGYSEAKEEPIPRLEGGARRREYVTVR
jgi:hypothetical protein